MLSYLYGGYCIEIIMFWERVGGVGKDKKATACWAGISTRQWFPCCDSVYLYFYVTIEVPYVAA